MTNSGIIIALAYPETVVMVSDVWYSSFLRFLGVGKKNYVRAGHAALVLINKTTSELEYHDFGRYICSRPHGRVRGKETDHELDLQLTANLEGNTILNLQEILEFLATHPKLTHGEGKLVASVCHAVDYNKARHYIAAMQQRQFIRYAAFIKKASNCARFVTDVLIASVTDTSIVKRLIKSKWFTPSTVGNVVIADTQNYIYEVSEHGKVTEYGSSVSTENIRCFLDRLKNYTPSIIGTLTPKTVHHVHEQAQWLGGIGAGAWFELHDTDTADKYRFRRISAYGHIDVDGLYRINNTAFNYHQAYTFVHYSNCAFYHIEQNQTIYRFDLIEILS